MRKRIDGLPVVDAKEPLTIHVRRCDLGRSSPKEPKSCVIAKAVGRELHPRGVKVHLSRVYINFDGKRWVRYQTPSGARQEIVAFDRGGSFEPGSYKLAAPRKSLRFGNKPVYAPAKKPGSRPGIRQYKITANVRAHA